MRRKVGLPLVLACPAVYILSRSCFWSDNLLCSPAWGMQVKCYAPENPQQGQGAHHAAVGCLARSRVEALVAHVRRHRRGARQLRLHPGHALRPAVDAPCGMNIRA